MLGVDTHRDVHVAAVLSVSGAVLTTDEFPATAAGSRDLLKRARKWGTVRRAGVEGTGSYGASLSRYLLAQGIDVFDVNRMDRADRRRRGKSDPLDAQNAARAVLSGRARARAKSGDGPVQIARMYKLTKASAVKARTQTINQLKAVLVTADPALREELAGLGNAELFRICARFAYASSREEVGEESVLQATRITLGLLASRIGQLSEQIREVDARLARLVKCHAPQLLDVVGIGPDTAVALLIRWGTTRNGWPARRRSPRCAASVPSSVPRDAGSSVASTVVATVRPMLRCIASCSPVCGSTRALRTTTSGGSRRARLGVKSSVVSNATLPGRSSTSSNSYGQHPAQCLFSIPGFE
ncbi:hypothetical protein GCM10027074_69830 [Streptomyces deserti]